MRILESLYRTLFRPGQGPVDVPLGAAIGILALLALVLALPDAGRLQTGALGAVGLCLLIFAVCLVGWFWVGAAMALLARFAGGAGTAEATLGAIAQACWPLLLVAPAVAIGNAGLPQLEHLIVAALTFWVAWLLVSFVRKAHGLSWTRSFLSWLAVMGATVLSGLVLLAAGTLLAVVWALT